jgi:CBS domain-containing protein
MDDQLSFYLIPLEATLIDAVQVIKENKSRCVFVHSDNKVIGVISEGDVMRALLHGADIHSPIENWLSHDFKFLPDLNYQRALELMSKYGITTIPILDENLNLVNVVTLIDVLERVRLLKNGF